MPAQTIKVADSAGALVGIVTVPDPPKQDLWPRHFPITWECVVAGCSLEGSYGMTVIDAYASLVEHLRNDHSIAVTQESFGNLV